MKDTIFAVSSGALPSGVAVVRLSGPSACSVVQALCGFVPEPRTAVLRKLRDPSDGDIIDQALILFFAGPASFTGEDVIELQCHGGRAVVARLLNVLSCQQGLRPAEAGEFTRRAFDNGKLDLTEVEGLSDLIAAETEVQRRQAMRQMDGALGRIYMGWRQRLIQLRAMVEADFDFADEDDIPESVADKVWSDAEKLALEITDHLARSKNAERLRSGLLVVLLGAPNAGKSSLLNAIAGREVAIVTEEAGTTRDIIEVHLDLDGYPMTLVDTAGLRKTDGRIEQEGIRRAWEKSRSADLILWAMEPGGLLPDDPSISDDYQIDHDVPLWIVHTKADLETLPKRDSSEIVQEITCSVVQTTGMNTLLTRLTRFARETIVVDGAALATRQRHRHYLMQSVAALTQSVSRSELPAELRAEELRLAADALGRITGRIDVEDLLDVIFREFCIGK